MKGMQTFVLALSTLALSAGGRLYAESPMGTAFTYQGQLAEAGRPVNDTADFVFTLWDAEAAGNLINTNLRYNLSVVNGLFQVSLDFGAAAFDKFYLYSLTPTASPHSTAFEVSARISTTNYSGSRTTYIRAVAETGTGGAVGFTRNARLKVWRIDV